MLQKILEKVIDTMTPYLDEEQVEKLGNVLYINFHDVEVKKECYELKPTGISGNAAKLDLFIKSKLAINRQSGTMKQYAREIWAALNFIGKDIDDIRAADIRYYFGYLREVKKLKMSTIQTRMHYLSSFWDFLTAEELVFGNPMKKIGAIKVEKVIRKPFSISDMEAMRSQCKRIRDRALIEFLYSTGVRISEAVALNVGDIDMDRLELIVFGKGSKERKTYLRFALVFLFVNLIGFAGYYIHPAAPPWYAINYGFEPILNTPGNVAGLGRFDEIFGVTIFDSIYGRNANVFAAVPSLHAAYMVVALVYAIIGKCRWYVIALFSVIMAGIWGTAIYSCHHYIIDVLLGISCALLGWLFFEYGLMKIRGFRNFFDRYYQYIK